MFRRSRRPRLRTQFQLQSHWQQLTQRSGEHRRGTQFLFLAPNGVATKIGRLDDVVGPLDYGQRDDFARLMDYFLDGDITPWRIALLITRPGPARVMPDDLEWAASLYGAARHAHVACEIVHLAAGDQVLPLPLDDMPDLAIGF